MYHVLISTLLVDHAPDIGGSIPTDSPPLDRVQGNRTLETATQGGVH